VWACVYAGVSERASVRACVRTCVRAGTVSRVHELVAAGRVCGEEYLSATRLRVMCTRSSLLNLTEVLFHRIYSFIPDFVAPHTAVCKAFQRCFMDKKAKKP